MPKTQCRITVHMVCSLDGFIAKPDNSISRFNSSSPYPKGVDMEDPGQFLKSVDCFIMGSGTYALATSLAPDYGWPYGEVPTFVLTSQDLETDRASIRFHKGELTAFIREEICPKYKNVWVVGGAITVGEFLRQQLADEIRINILPILLGSGLPFFKFTELEQNLELKDSKAYKNGMVELCYAVRKSGE